jgi:hypothetical protein
MAGITESWAQFMKWVIARSGDEQQRFHSCSRAPKPEHQRVADCYLTRCARMVKHMGSSSFDKLHETRLPSKVYDGIRRCTGGAGCWG